MDDLLPPNPPQTPPAPVGAYPSGPPPASPPYATPVSPPPQHASFPPAAPPPYLPPGGAAAGAPPMPPIIPPVGPPAGPPASPADATGPSRTGRKAAVVGMTVVASLVAGAAGGWIAGRESAGSSNTAASGATVPSTRTVSAELSGNDLDVAAILAKVGPSVVAVNTQVTQRRGPYIAQGQGAGTGVVLTADGQILTNAHVIDGATAITVSVEGSDQQLPATLVAKDTANDLALLQVTGVSDLTPATLGDSDATIVGDDVVAVGNALALEGGMSVTRGIVSALHRSIEAGSESGSESLSGLIQTDAAISSGNSGGPLVNSKGEVIGINTAVAGSGNGTTASNIGFAIPIDTAKTIVERLRTSGG